MVQMHLKRQHPKASQLVTREQIHQDKVLPRMVQRDITITTAPITTITLSRALRDPQAPTPESSNYSLTLGGSFAAVKILLLWAGTLQMAIRILFKPVSSSVTLSERYIVFSQPGVA
jgi:hypothetical protein